MKIQYTLIAVFSVMAFSLCGDSNAQLFRQVTQPLVVPQPATFTQTMNAGARYVSNVGEAHRENDKFYETDLRHVYRPIKNGMKKQGVNGQTLILAEYIGTHRKDPNEKRIGSFQDGQYGGTGQRHVKTDLAGKKVWMVPFLDGTLRWVPLINKD